MLLKNFVYFLLLTIAAGHIWVEETLNNHVLLAEAALHVTQRFISNRTNTFVIMELCKHCQRARQNFQCRLLDHFLLNFDNSMTLQLFVGEPDDYPWGFNVFIVDSVEAFREKLLHFPETLHERNFYFLIILTHTENLDRGTVTSMMYDIFESSLAFYVGNAVIMLEEFEGIVNFYSYRKYGPECNEKISLEHINQYRLTNGLRNPYLFMRAPNNLFNCTINVAAQETHPMLIFSGDKSNKAHLSDQRRILGIDGVMLSLVAKALNFQIAMKFIEAKSEIYSATNATGVFPLLQNGVVDVAIGGLSASIPNSCYFTSSTIYHHSHYVFIVRSALQYDILAQLMRPFQPNVWLAILGVFLIMSFICTILISSCRRQNASSINISLNLFSSFLGNPIPRLTVRLSLRLVFFSWLLSTFFLRSFYQANIFDALRISLRKPLPKNIDELIANDYYLLTTQYRDFYPHNLTRILFVESDTRYQEIALSANNVRLTTISYLDHLAYHNLVHWNSSCLTYINDPVYQLQLVAFFKKHSLLKNVFDRKLKQLMASGITSYIVRQYVKKKFLAMNKHAEYIASIGNEMLTGIYIIYAILMGLSIVVFVMEIIVFKMCNAGRKDSANHKA